MLSLNRFLRTRPRQRGRSNNVASQIQNLESRAMLDGRVTVVLAANGNVTIRGDGDDNDITVTITEDEITVEGNDGTDIRFRGDTEAEITEDIDRIRNVTINMGGGDDAVEVLIAGGVEVEGTVNVNLGSGDDFFGLLIGGAAEFNKDVKITGGTGAEDIFIGAEGAAADFAKNISINTGNEDEDDFVGIVAGEASTIEVAGKLDIKTGKGDDEILFGTEGDLAAAAGFELDLDEEDLAAVHVDDGINISSGDGSDQIAIAGVSTNGNATIDAGSGNNKVGIAAVGVDGNLTVKTGKGADLVGLDDALVNGKTSISTGDGSDDVAVTDVELNGDATIDLGKGNDDLVIAGVDLDEGDDATIKGGDGADRGNAGEGFDPDADNVDISSITFGEGGLPADDEGDDPAEETPVLDDVEDIVAAIEDIFAVLGD